MPTPHIGANKGDFAKVVLMPGDPKRAEFMAKTYLKDPVLVTDVRGILGYTGLTKNGKRISIMASGMGIPSIGIYSTELFQEFGVETIIRVGTCGCYQPNIDLNDIIISMGSCTDSNWMSQYRLNGCTYSAIADFEAVEEAVKQARAFNKPFHVGNTLAADVFYDHDPEVWKKWAGLGVLAVEMESYSLYQVAAENRKRALCILTVSDNFVKHGQLTIEQRQTGLTDMIEIGIATAEKFA